MMLSDVEFGGSQARRLHVHSSKSVPERTGISSLYPVEHWWRKGDPGPGRVPGSGRANQGLHDSGPFAVLLRVDDVMAIVNAVFRV